MLGKKIYFIFIGVCQSFSGARTQMGRRRRSTVVKLENLGAYGRKRVRVHSVSTCDENVSVCNSLRSSILTFDRVT